MDNFDTEQNDRLMELDWYQMGELFDQEYGDSRPVLPEGEVDVKDIVEF